MSEQTSREVSSSPSEAQARGPWWTSLRLWSICACVLMVLTVLILPLPLAVRASILGVLIFSAVFVAVDAGGWGKTFAALTCALLTLYLVHIAQQGFVMLTSGSVAGIVLGAGMILLPILGAWALVREVLFGARIQRMAQELAASGELRRRSLRASRRRWSRNRITGRRGSTLRACTMPVVNASVPVRRCVTRGRCVRAVQRRVCGRRCPWQSVAGTAFSFGMRLITPRLCARFHRLSRKYRGFERVRIVEHV